MKKRYKIIISLSLVLVLFAHWLLQPSSLNPFEKSPVALTTSQVDFDCALEQSTINDLKAKADSTIDQFVLNNEFISVTAGVSKVDCGTWIGNSGFADKQNLKRSNRETLYRTASIAKPVTAVAIMQLYEKGILKLDIPIQTYLPEFPAKPEGDITVRQLLNHTSGIKHYSSDLAVLSFTHYDNLIHALDKFKDRPLSFEPGTNYEYTTYGYTVLGAIIEKVSGTSFQEHMKKNIFLPAGMINTDIEEDNKEYTNKAELYIKIKGKYIRSPKTDLSLKYPGGGFHTTAEDFVRFGKAIIQNKLIDSTTLDMMVNNTSDIKQGTPYGFGWYIYEHDKKGTILMHGGSQSGTSSELNIMLDHGIVSVALANNFGSNYGTQQTCFKLSDLFYDLEIKDSNASGLY